MHAFRGTTLRIEGIMGAGSKLAGRGFSASNIFKLRRHRNILISEIKNISLFAAPQAIDSFGHNPHIILGDEPLV